MQVLKYLKAENEYCQAVMSDTAQLQEALFKEMRGRIQEEDASVPVRDAGFFYYTRTLEGKQYGVHCRRRIPALEEGEIVDEDTVMDSTCARLYQQPPFSFLLQPSNGLRCVRNTAIWRCDY